VAKKILTRIAFLILFSFLVALDSPVKAACDSSGCNEQGSAFNSCSGTCSDRCWNDVTQYIGGVVVDISDCDSIGGCSAGKCCILWQHWTPECGDCCWSGGGGGCGDPGQPEPLSFSSITSTSVRVSWPAVNWGFENAHGCSEPPDAGIGCGSGNRGYVGKICSGDYCSDGGTLVDTLSCTTNRYWDISGLNSSTNYYVYIWSINTCTCDTRKKDTFATLVCPAVSSPANLASVCPVPGSNASLTWNEVAGASYYHLRVNDTQNNWNGSCSSPNPGDFCADVQSTACSGGSCTYSFTSDLDHDYTWWLDSRNDCGSLSALTVGSPFHCQAIGTITGSVYDSCSCTGTENSPPGWGVMSGFEGGGTCDGSAGCDALACCDIHGNNYVFTEAEYGNYTIFITPPLGWYSICGQSQNITLDSPLAPVADFYFCREPGSWWQAVGASVHAETSVSSQIPSTAADKSLILNGLDGYHGILSYRSGVLPDLGTGGGQVSVGGEEAGSSYLDIDYDYSWWLEHLEDEPKDLSFSGGSLPHPGGEAIYKTSGGPLNISGNVGANEKLVILHDGNININSDIQVINSGFLLVIASGQITIDPSVEFVQGIFIAQNINVPTAGSEDDPVLYFSGSLIAWGDISLDRDRGLAGAVNPPMTFTFRPDFMANAPNFIKMVFYDWQQISG